MIFVKNSPYLDPPEVLVLAMWVPELPFQLACGRDGGLRDRPLAFLNPESPRSPSLWFRKEIGRAHV